MKSIFYLVVIAFLAFSPPETVANVDQEIATHQVDVQDFDLDQGFTFHYQTDLTQAGDIGTPYGGFAVPDAETILSYRVDVPPNWVTENRLGVQPNNKPHPMKTISNNLTPELVFRC